MNMPKYLRVIEYTASYDNGYTLDKVAMFNETVVSENEVKSWIEQGIFECENKPQVVIMTKKQYENLYDKELSNNNKELYEDLYWEQREQM